MRLTHPAPTNPAPDRRTPAGAAARPVRTRTTRRLRTLLATAGLTAAVLASMAAAAYADPGPAQVAALAGSVQEVLANLRDWVMGILAGLATVFLTIGGVRYLMAGGDPGEVEKAKTAFKSAGWGYAGAALAPLVVQVLQGIVGA
jgi:Type IV secretion system pilin